ncbi:MAG: hypothetical protein LUD83_04525 [Clostridiales bacterium]|nr:hypothetical protein [Clostridiales bacterium]
MPTSQWDMISRQSAAAARNAAAGAVARARRETSLVGQASRLSAEAMRQGENAVKQASGTGVRRKGRPAPESVVSDPVSVHPAPDGYVRRSPVQPIYEAADYHNRIIRRIVNGVVVVIVALVLVWLLLRSGILAF